MKHFDKYLLQKSHVYLGAKQKDLKCTLTNHLNSVHEEVSHSKHPKCYICNQHFNPYLVPERYVHHCSECGLLEYQKRIAKVDLSSLKVYVSGCRIKIGYSTVLRFLRLGATVIGSTRFPKLAWLNFQKEPDFKDWRYKLTIICADFKSFRDVNNLIIYLKNEKINVLVNNAAQTIRPSEKYLLTLDQAEKKLSIESEWKDKSVINTINTVNTSKSDQKELEVVKGSDIVSFGNTSVLELNRYGDINDIQGRNSTWFKNIDEIEPAEIIEITTINQVVPTLLINQLKPTMSQPAFLINVTAVEGQFNITSKDHCHPANNMAKAAINMMIRTMAEEKNPKVLPYAIDPGFVSGVRERTLKTGITPIQSDDGASRIVDPVIEWFRGEKPGKYVLKPGKYRHYKLDDW